MDPFDNDYLHHTIFPLAFYPYDYYMNVIFDHSQAFTDSISSFYFRPETPWAYVPGQFIQLRLPHEPVDDRFDRRWFSLSSAPTEPLLAITTRFATGQSSTFKQALRALKPGTSVEMAPASGDFVLPEDPAVPVVLIAGGIGITPMRSMVKWLSDTNASRTVQLVHAANAPGELIFRDLFEAYGLNYIPVVRDAPEGWTGETGLLNAPRILDLVGGAEGKRFYVSGPKPMVEAFAGDLETKGVPHERLVHDYFPGYTAD